jgi:YhcH/YjgK/YiaL family protein
VIYYAPVSGLCPLDDYNAEKDVLLYADPAASTALHFPRGTLAIFHPNDGHKPGCANGASSFVRKIVIKVRL